MLSMEVQEEGTEVHKELKAQTEQANKRPVNIICILRQRWWQAE